MKHEKDRGTLALSEWLHKEIYPDETFTSLASLSNDERQFGTECKIILQ